MFDVDERKRTEEKLFHLQQELEALSYKDGLTGVANRRRFDAAMDVEWMNARRYTQPLSLLIVPSRDDQSLASSTRSNVAYTRPSSRAGPGWSRAASSTPSFCKECMSRQKLSLGVNHIFSSKASDA